MANINSEIIKKYVKTGCELYKHCDGLDIKKMVEHWYGLHNIPITENPSNIEDNIQKYKSKPIQNTGSLYILQKVINIIIKIINKIFDSKISLGDGNSTEKYKLYNIISYFLHYTPTYFISFVLLYFNDFKSLFNLNDNVVLEKWPTNFVYIFSFFVIITIFFILNGSRKIYLCLEKNVDHYYIFGILYSFVLILINNFIIPLFSNNLLQNNENASKGLTIGLTSLSTIIFSLITVFTYIQKRFNLDKSINIKDSLFFTVFNKYIINIINILITIFLISSVCIKLLNTSGTFFVSLLMGIIYFIYFLIFYVHIYGLLEGNNFNKIGLYTILLIIGLTLFCIYFLYEMVNNLEEVCSTEDPSGNDTTTTTTTSPFKILITILIIISLIILSIYLFGMVYTDKNWKANKLIFYVLYIVYTILVFSSPLYTIENSTVIFIVIWFIISCIQHKFILKLLILFKCLITNFFKEF